MRWTNEVIKHTNFGRIVRLREHVLTLQMFVWTCIPAETAVAMTASNMNEQSGITIAHYNFNKHKMLFNFIILRWLCYV